MKKLIKLGETFRGSKGTYLISKGHIDKYELFINENYLQKQDSGDLHCTFNFIQAFQFKKDALKMIEEIEWEYIHSEEHLQEQLAYGLINKEEFDTKIRFFQQIKIIK
tara:strand:- start:2087 stop:2410 length:324 start_codon:yes stop_codon:yes gene_type:complete